MIHVLCGRASTSALILANALGGRRGRDARRVAPGDSVVNWGWSIAPGLNQNAGRTKRTEMRKLHEAGVPTLEVSFVPRPDWIPRAASHREGLDILHGLGAQPPALWTKREHFIHEFRVHIFKQRDGSYASVRFGAKFPRPDLGGASPHEWVRSYAGGWRILYNADAQQLGKRFRGIRDAAKAAVAALDLDFGAVDIGVTDQGKALVLEVNSAPGLEGRTIQVYRDSILALLEGQNG